MQVVNSICLLDDLMLQQHTIRTQYAQAAVHN